MTNFKATAHSQNFQLDLLGRPIKVGDRVLTKAYGSPSMDCFATVVSVNRKSISIDVNLTKYERSASGSWHRVPAGTKRMNRIGFTSVLVVNELEPISTALADAFIQDHPELAI